jgi:quinoprotein glucose dehydrogenase
MKKYRLGPLFTPPSLEGTLMRPGVIGGANWGGGALDPDTGIVYVKSTNGPAVARIQKVMERTAGVLDAEFSMAGGNASFHNGLPLTKPPYGHLTAIDLNRGEILWHVPFGDDERIRSHPALRDVKLPERLGVQGAPGAIVTKAGIVFVGGGDSALHAVDTANGKDLWVFALGRRTTATPMTYRTTSGRQLVVIASGSGRDATLTAFGL